METHSLQFTFIPPAFGKKNQLCTTNTISKWYRFAKTKIKQEFQVELTEWFLPEWEDNPYTKADIEFTVLRKDGKNLDSDSFSVSAYKWLRDMLVTNGYLIDDNMVKQTMHPTLLHVEGNIETSVRVEITLYERYEMTVEELRATVDILQAEMEKVGGEGHVKNASGRVRKILGEIKNATPELRRELVDLDKK